MRKKQKGDRLFLAGFFLIVVSGVALWIGIVFGESTDGIGTTGVTTYSSPVSTVRSAIVPEVQKTAEPLSRITKTEIVNPKKDTTSNIVLSSPSSTETTSLVKDKDTKTKDQETASLIKEKDIKIDTQVKDTTKTKKVDVYAKDTAKSEAVPASFIGSATPTTDNSWTLNVDASQKLPNGNYEVYSKVETEEGKYVSTEKKVDVNLPVKDITQEEKDKITQSENSSADSDQDGISDKEEIRLGTNPFSTDTDQDGYQDSDEIKNGFDPLKASIDGDKSDKMVFQSPKEMGEVSDKYKVTNVKTKNKDGENVTNLQGKGLPNSFITLYIYSSDPIVITVKTDADGNWEYDLDKKLEDGQHEVYVTVNDNTGKITAKSEPIAFIKTAEAIDVVEASELDSLKSAQDQTLNRKFGIDFIFFSIILVASFIGLALFSIGLLINFMHNKNEGSV